MWMLPREINFICPSILNNTKSSLTIMKSKYLGTTAENENFVKQFFKEGLIKVIRASFGLQPVVFSFAN
jgi:hypothetical protein